MSEHQPPPIRIAVAGAGGRMGRSVVNAIADDRGFQLTAAITRPAAIHREGSDGNQFLDRGLVTTDADQALSKADVLIDFTAPDHSTGLVRAAADLHVPCVIGTTGFDSGQEAQIRAAAAAIPIVKSGNMSIGIALLASLVKQAAGALPGFDIEILEMHHRMKRDAPSGTALLLGDAAAAGRDLQLPAPLPDRRGTRAAGDIGFASLRGGTVVGEHAVIFAGPSERIILSHSAEDRSVFARGALIAARWVLRQAPALYSMADVLAT